MFMPVMAAIVVGMVPNKEFFAKFKVEILGNVKILEGIVPVKEFFVKTKFLIFLMVPMLVGMVPDKELLTTENLSNMVKRPISVGNVEERLVLSRYSPVRLVNFPTWVGMGLPARSLLDKSKKIKDVNKAISGGIVPVKLLSLSSRNCARSETSCD